MASWSVATFFEGLQGAGEDRLGVVWTPGGGIGVVVADGAGGTGSGAEAATFAVDALTAALSVGAPLDAALETVDAALHRSGGETTCVALRWEAGWLVGAAVGDSEAWWLAPGAAPLALTLAVPRKPLLGSGRAIPLTFGCAAASGTLLVGSDGLFDHVQQASITPLMESPDLAAALAGLIAQVRLPGGGLQDDLAVVLVRQGELDERRALRSQPTVRKIADR